MVPVDFDSGGLVSDDTTPLDPDEANGIRLSWIATRSDLNAAEGANIASGRLWATRRPLSATEILAPVFLRQLHRRMFGEVWAWAGKYRTTEKSIGIDPMKIAPAIADAAADCRFWIDDVSPERWATEEIAIRFHHRLVCIHPFPNGNGRHGRLAADLLVTSLGEPQLSWGGTSLSEVGDLRRAYVSGLIAADQGDIAPLLAFARS